MKITERVRQTVVQSYFNKKYAAQWQAMNKKFYEEAIRLMDKRYENLNVPEELKPYVEYINNIYVRYDSEAHEEIRTLSKKFCPLDQRVLAWLGKTTREEWEMGDSFTLYTTKAFPKRNGDCGGWNSDYFGDTERGGTKEEELFVKKSYAEGLAFMRKIEPEVDELHRVLNSFTTTKQLLKACPSIGEYLPAECAPEVQSTMLIPKELLDKVNKMLA